MPDDPSDPLEPPIPLARRMVLPYQGFAASGAVTVRSCYDAFEAQLYGNQLAAHGIDYCLLNQNANVMGPYLGLTQVELQVRREDAPLANKILTALQIDPLLIEPEEYFDPAVPMRDLEGDGWLMTAAAFESAREMYDAAAVIGSAQIECFLPALVPRGDRPPGKGRRFALRVRAADLARARELILEAAADAERDDEPRCPKCGSWRVHELPPPWRGFGHFLLSSLFAVVGSGGPRTFECLRCHHQWPE